MLVTPVKPMRHLDLSENALTGTIPARYLESPQLVELRLNGNRLSGQIPQSSLQFSTQLVHTPPLSATPTLARRAPLCRLPAHGSLVCRRSC